MKSSDAQPFFSLIYKQSKVFAEIVDCIASGAILGLTLGGAITSVTAAIPLLMSAGSIIMGVCMAAGSLVGAYIGIKHVRNSMRTTSEGTQTSSHPTVESEDLEVPHSPRSPHSPKSPAQLNNSNHLITPGWNYIQGCNSLHKKQADDDHSSTHSYENKRRKAHH